MNDRFGALLTEPQMAKAKPKGEQPAHESKQFNFRADPVLAARIEKAARGLGLDLSNFLRMVLIQNLPRYEGDKS